MRGSLLTVLSRIRPLWVAANKQPHAYSLAYRVSIFVVTALLAVAIKSPQAFAQPLDARLALSARDSLIIGADDKRTHSAPLTRISDSQSVRDQVASDGLSVSTVVQPLQITTELQQRRVFTKLHPIVRLQAGLAPGTRRVIRQGNAQVTLITERVTKWNGIVVDGQVVGKRLIRRARASEIAMGPPRTISEAMALTKFRKLVGVFAMVATAYTAGSAQSVPTGRTATGLLARYGVVAVDPRIIPLGAHVFIPGYGTAVAADTGGSIVGNRIDLCMDSLQAALNFGRQSVKVYVLSQ